MFSIAFALNNDFFHSIVLYNFDCHSKINNPKFMPKKTELQKYHDQVLSSLSVIKDKICKELSISDATFYNILSNKNGRYNKCSPAEREVIAKHYGLQVIDLWKSKKNNSTVK